MPDAVGAGHSTRWPLWKIIIVRLIIATTPVTVPIVFFVGFLVYDGVSADFFYARTPFVANLPGPTIQAQQRQFAERAEGAFPVGMPVDELERMLMPQGFSPSHQADEDRLHVEHGIFPCLMGWDVVWTARDGKVAAARGTMTATCL